MTGEELVARAEAAAAHAYAPYSNYLVGATVLTTDGRTYDGVNVENAAYPLGICAEKTAIAKAASDGVRPGEIEAIGINASPCGGCRQWLHEWGVEADLLPARGRLGRRVRAGRPPAGHVGSSRRMKSGFVAIAGRPNVGKSTLVNALCGGKVAIVSDKPQTTRRRIFGIANGDDHQLVLVDLPGFQRPRDALTERMQRTVDSAFEDVDAVVFVLSARERIGAGDRFIASRVFALSVPVVIALNKVDRLKPGHIAQQMNAAARLGNFHALHPVSAKTGDGIGELRDELVGLLPEGPLYFPAEQRTDLSVAEQISELVREKALALTRDEVPHSISVEVEELGETFVRANVLVETDSQKQILVGKHGAMVKEIGTRARPEIEALLGQTVFLELMVKVRPHWRRNETTLERLGL